MTENIYNNEKSSISASEPYNSVESTQALYILRFVHVVRFLSLNTALYKAPNVLDAFTILQLTSKSNFPEASILDPRYVKSRTYSMSPCSVRIGLQSLEHVSLPAAMTLVYGIPSDKPKS